MKKSVNQRVAEHTQKQKDAGLVQVRVWTDPDNRDAIKFVAEHGGNALEGLESLQAELDAAKKMLAEISDEDDSTLLDRIERLEHDLGGQKLLNEELNHCNLRLKEDFNTLMGDFRMRGTQLDTATAEISRLTKEAGSTPLKPAPELGVKEGTNLVALEVAPEKLEMVQAFINAQNAAQKVINNRK